MIKNIKMYNSFIEKVRDEFMTDKFIPLHEPRFIGNEKIYINDAIDSTFVSSVGKYVDQFENTIKLLTGSKFAIATVNGTSALHIALLLTGTTSNCEVITQPISFVATCNAISYTGAIPVFVDVDLDTMGLSPIKLRDFLEKNTIIKDGICINKLTGRKITACVPMHTFGFPCRIREICEICSQFLIHVVEDSAESLGSYLENQHTGTFGLFGVFSLNGNKTVTSGGGGVIVTNNEYLAKKAKHITTTAKVPHKWEYFHDEIGFNYRMPNLNAALACAQLENLEKFILNKRELADSYKVFFKESSIKFICEMENTRANYWLMTILLQDRTKRDDFLNFTNSNGIMTRPIWTLMHKLPMFNKCQVHSTKNSEYLEERIVNIPSSVRIN
jgi:perosamine synthetase